MTAKLKLSHTSVPVSCLILLLVVACSGGGNTATKSTTTTPADSMAKPSVDGRFATGDGNRRLALRCWGKGSPTIIYDAGTGDTGIGQAKASKVFQDLASSTRVCSYDRAGIGASDPAPPHKRYLDDVVDDLDGVLKSAKVEPPYLLVGSSGGGGDIYQHAGRHPEDVVGLVMLDVPAGQANIPPSEVPAWDSAENPEHMDYAAVERQMALHRLPIGPIPVTVVTASAGQSADPKEQRVWLKGSSRPAQVILDGGHDIWNEDPDGVLAEIQKVLKATRVN